MAGVYGYDAESLQCDGRSSRFTPPLQFSPRLLANNYASGVSEQKSLRQEMDTLQLQVAKLDDAVKRADKGAERMWQQVSAQFDEQQRSFKITKDVLQHSVQAVQESQSWRQAIQDVEKTVNSSIEAAKSSLREELGSELHGLVSKDDAGSWISNYESLRFHLDRVDMRASRAQEECLRISEQLLEIERRHETSWRNFDMTLGSNKCGLRQWDHQDSALTWSTALPQRSQSARTADMSDRRAEMSAEIRIASVEDAVKKAIEKCRSDFEDAAQEQLSATEAAMEERFMLEVRRSLERAEDSLMHAFREQVSAFNADTDRVSQALDFKKSELDRYLNDLDHTMVRLSHDVRDSLVSNGLSPASIDDVRSSVHEVKLWVAELRNEVAVQSAVSAELRGSFSAASAEVQGHLARLDDQVLQGRRGIVGSDGVAQRSSPRGGLRPKCQWRRAVEARFGCAIECLRALHVSAGLGQGGALSSLQRIQNAEAKAEADAQVEDKVLREAGLTPVKALYQ